MTETNRTYEAREEVVNGVTVKVWTPVLTAEERKVAMARARAIRAANKANRRKINTKSKGRHVNPRHQAVLDADRAASHQYGVNYKLRDFMK